MIPSAGNPALTPQIGAPTAGAAPAAAPAMFGGATAINSGLKADSVSFGSKVKFGNETETTEQTEETKSKKSFLNPKNLLGSAKTYAIPAAEIALGTGLAVPGGILAHFSGLFTMGIGNAVGIALHVVGGALALHGLLAGLKKYKAAKAESAEA